MARGPILVSEKIFERLNDASGVYFEGTLLERRRTPFQLLEVYETAELGRIFRLDGFNMTSERDEFFYHENLVHPAAVAHPAPRQALVIGGGDGRSPLSNLRQLFRRFTPYFVHIPLYGSIWGFACASDVLDPRAMTGAEVERVIAARGLRDLQYYNGETHQAVFALPNYVRDLLK